MDATQYRPVPRNRIKDAIRSKRKAFGYALGFFSVEVSKFLGHLDFDFVWIDGEHGGIDLSQVESLCRAGRTEVGITPIARIPQIAGCITGFLDRGVQGIIAPHIDTRAEAEQIVRASYFGPLGDRSYGGARPDGFGYGADDLTAYLTARNENTAVAVMIESGKAVENLDEILKVPGIDYYVIGQVDLAQSLGHPGKPNHPEVVKVAAEVADRVRAAGSQIREDFMVYGFVQDLLLEGALALREAGKDKVGRVLNPGRRLSELRPTRLQP